KKGVVTITSEPAGAEVAVGGISFGKTPVYNHEGEAGVHPIQVSLAGYQPYSSEIQVIPGQLNTVMVQLYPLQPSVTGQSAGSTVEFTVTTSCIRFNSDPPGADIYVDSRFVGMTPADICGLSPGKHETSLMLPFYKIYQEDVNPQPGEVVDVRTSFTLDELEIPGIGMILGIFSDLKFPGLPPLPGGGTPEQETPGQMATDRQKAYEELVKSIEEEG
ncbi:MAG: PEGA domain-containing protein, partial [Methanoregulaceae archaeon]|nr:PEGA domain-containing protein [Methanoregulaceae archaeon]